MTITRRTVLTGIGAAAIAPALPSAQPVIMAGPWPTCQHYVEPLVVYGRGPMMDCLPNWRAFNDAMIEGIRRTEAAFREHEAVVEPDRRLAMLAHAMQTIADEEADEQ